MTTTTTGVSQGAVPKARGSRRGGGIAGQPQATQPAQAQPTAPPQPVPPPAVTPTHPKPAQAVPPAKAERVDLTKPIGNAVQYRALLAQYQDEFAALLPQGQSAAQWVRSAWVAWGRTFNIQSCRAGSIRHSLAIAAEMGLPVDGTGNEAWLAAFSNKHLPDDQKEAILLVGYGGLLRLAFQHPRVAWMKRGGSAWSSRRSSGPG